MSELRPGAEQLARDLLTTKIIEFGNFCEGGCSFVARTAFEKIADCPSVLVASLDAMKDRAEQSGILYTADGRQRFAESTHATFPFARVLISELHTPVLYRARMVSGKSPSIIRVPCFGLRDEILVVDSVLGEKKVMSVADELTGAFEDDLERRNKLGATPPEDYPRVTKALALFDPESGARSALKAEGIDAVSVLALGELVCYAYDEGLGGVTRMLRDEVLGRRSLEEIALFAP